MKSIEDAADALEPIFSYVHGAFEAIVDAIQESIESLQRK